MTAITVAFTTIGATATNPDKPLDSALMTALKDRTQYVLEWLGASYTAGAVQNHNHDGVNSALVEIGPNYLRNGSFEQGTEGFTLSPYTGGTIATNTANDMDGATALAITSTVLANGGGLVTSNEYVPVTGGEAVEVKFAIKASVANVSSRVDVVWYDEAQSQISVSTLYNPTNTPTGLSIFTLGAAAPAAARFFRLVLVGGVPGVGSATGTVYFDGIRTAKVAAAVAGSYPVSVTKSGSTTNNTPTKLIEFVAAKSGIYSTVLTLVSNNGGPTARGRIYKNGVAFGTDRSAITLASFSENLAFNKGDLVQGYAWHTVAGETSSITLRLDEGVPSGLYMA